MRILTTEPLISITPERGAGQAEIERAWRSHEDQFQDTDILSGRMCPELRGRPEYLDLLGLNLYYNNQWVKATGERLDWKNTDDRWVPLHELLRRVHERYGRPFVLTETSHPGVDRPLWMDTMSQECAATLTAGMPLWGVCWYPIIDRPDWDHPHHWHQSGVCDRVATEEAVDERRLHEPTAGAFLRAQATPAAIPRSRSARP